MLYMEKIISRRKMIRQSALFAGGICTCSALLADGLQKSTCCNTPEISKDCYLVSDERIIIDLAQVKALDTPGHAALIVDAAKNFQIIIVRPNEQDYVALSRICTHGGNVVSYNPKRNILQCNNYNHSIFDLTGGVVKGPAEEPLHVYPLKVEGNSLVITLEY
jgi:nitrite reductase/ring-hydroxylating ferredoxin subunit